VGLQLVYNGFLTGVPTMEGICGPLTLRVDDSAGQSDTQEDLTILIELEPVLGRNDSIDTATPLTTYDGSVGYAASISPFTDPPNLLTPDTDYYRVTANAGATVTIEIFARRITFTSKLDSVLEIVDVNGARFTTCRNEGDFDGLGLDLNPDGTLRPDPTPLAFDDPCINDDIELGVNRDSKLEFLVPGSSGTVTFYVHVLDWRGDARPDFLYQFTISIAN